VKNYRIVDTCTNCRFCDDIGIGFEDLVCLWCIEHDEYQPEDDHVHANGVCDYFERGDI
jgi:hypothetical protein